MDQADIEQVMQRAVAAVGHVCHANPAPANLARPDATGWRCIGTITIPAEWKAWQVFWNPVLGKGCLWAMRWDEKGATPRRFEPPE